MQWEPGKRDYIESMDRYAAVVFRSMAWILTLLALVQVAVRKGWL